MRYLSTRAAGPASATHSFEDVLLAGLAEDGGLFVPEALPKLDAGGRGMRANCRLSITGMKMAWGNPRPGQDWDTQRTFQTWQRRPESCPGIKPVPPPAIIT